MRPDDGLLYRAKARNIVDMPCVREQRQSDFYFRGWGTVSENSEEDLRRAVEQLPLFDGDQMLCTLSGVKAAGGGGAAAAFSKAAKDVVKTVHAALSAKLNYGSEEVPPAGSGKPEPLKHMHQNFYWAELCPPGTPVRADDGSASPGVARACSAPGVLRLLGMRIVLRR